MENKHIAMLVVLAVIVVVLILVFATGGKETVEEQIESEPADTADQQPAETETSEDAAAENAEETVEIPETEAGPGLVTDDALETGDYTQHSLLGEPQNADAAMAKDLTAEPERFSNFDCVKDEETGVRYITLKVTNTNEDQDFMISPVGVAKGYNTYFMVRGIVDMDPGCQTEQLKPGESTVCLMVGQDDERYGNPAGTNRLTIQSPDNAGKTTAEAVVVNCPE